MHKQSNQLKNLNALNFDGLMLLTDTRQITLQVLAILNLMTCELKANTKTLEERQLSNYSHASITCCRISHTDGRYLSTISTATVNRMKTEHK